MALQQARDSQAVVCVRLRQIPTLPTTEDLLYLLSTCLKNKKPAELPFNNPYNNLDFVIRVVPATRQLAPRWTFEKFDGVRNINLWTRETNEVIMIQGKIKIEANYSGEISPEDLALEAQKSTGSQPIIMGAPSISVQNLAAFGQIEDQSVSGANFAPIEPKNLSTSPTWLFSEHGPSPVAMPPPVALGQNVVKNYMEALSNPSTGLLRHTAFEFFLLRDLEYVQKYGGKLSLLALDFALGENDDEAALPIILTAALKDCCSPLEICTQLKSGEFAILLCGYDGAKALLFAQMLCDKLPAGLAIGVACIPETCKDPGTLIAAAIKAKNLARQSQRNYMLFPLF